MTTTPFGRRVLPSSTHLPLRLIAVLWVAALLIVLQTPAHAQGNTPLAFNTLVSPSWGVPLKSGPTSTAEMPNTAAVQAVKGTLKFHGSYCMGVAPTEEHLKWLHTPWVDNTRKMYVTQCWINGKQQLAENESQAKALQAKATVITTFVTDEKGQFSLQLPPGEYQISLDPKMACCRFYTEGMNQYQPLTIVIPETGTTPPAALNLTYNLSCTYTRPQSSY